MPNKAQSDWLVKLGVAAFNTAEQAIGGAVKTATGPVTPEKAPDPWDAPPTDTWKKPNGNKIHDVVTGKGSDAAKAKILAQAGYCQFDIEVIGIDYRGESMDKYNVSIHLKSPGFDEGFAIGTMADGSLMFKGRWAGREGSVHVDALNMDSRVEVGTPNNPNGVASYKVDKGKLKLKIVQDCDVVDVGDTDSRETGDKYGDETQLEGGAELDLGVGKIGDKGSVKHSSEHDYTKGASHSTTRKQRLPTNRLQVEQIP